VRRDAEEDLRQTFKASPIVTISLTSLIFARPAKQRGVAFAPPRRFLVTILLRDAAAARFYRSTLCHRHWAVNPMRAYTGRCHRAKTRGILALLPTGACERMSRTSSHRRIYAPSTLEVVAHTQRTQAMAPVRRKCRAAAGRVGTTLGATAQ